MEVVHATILYGDLYVIVKIHSDVWTYCKFSLMLGGPHISGVVPLTRKGCRVSPRGKSEVSIKRFKYVPSGETLPFVMVKSNFCAWLIPN